MKKQILLSILSIGIVASFLGASTFAYFSDIETSVGNTITVGTDCPDLIVWWPVPPYNIPATRYDDDDENYGPLPVIISVSNMLPGDSGETRVHVNNIGDDDGTLYFNITDVVNDENGVQEPELNDCTPADTSDDGPGYGELGEYLLITVLYGDDNWPIEDYYKAIDNMALNELEDNPQELGDLYYEGQGLDGKDVVIQWELPTSTGNIVQSDNVTFSIVFYLQMKV